MLCPPDEKLMTAAVRGKTILVSGAGGFIGSELCRQLVSYLPATLILLERSEYALYTIDNTLRALNTAPEGQV